MLLLPEVCTKYHLMGISVLLYSSLHSEKNGVKKPTVIFSWMSIMLSAVKLDVQVNSNIEKDAQVRAAVPAEPRLLEVKVITYEDAEQPVAVNVGLSSHQLHEVKVITYVDEEDQLPGAQYESAKEHSPPQTIVRSLPSSVSPESKAKPPARPYKLKYLSEMSAEDKLQIEKTYRCSTELLDQSISRHWIRFYLKRGKYILAVSSNFLFVIFQAKTAQNGVPAFVHVFFPNVTVPVLAGQLIGYPSAILDCLTYTWNFSPKREALLELLVELALPPLRVRIKEALLFAWN